MSLPSRSIEKFLRENFSDKNPIIVRADQREQWMEKIKARIDGMRNIEFSSQPNFRYASDADEVYLGGFRIYDPESGGSHYRDSTGYSFKRNAQDQLYIDTGYIGATALISDLDELVHFVAVCNERLDRRSAGENKRGKIRALKTQAVIGQVRKLAKEDKFNFAIETDKVKLKLFVELYQDDCIVLNIPFTEFQEVLPKLKSILQSATILYEHGVKLQMRKKSGHGRGRTWVNHEDL